MSVVELSSSMLDELVVHAGKTARGRLHRNLHDTHDAPVQRLFNAVGMDSYIRPHRHWQDPKTETLLAVRGTLTFVTFDDEGAITKAIRIGEQFAGCVGNTSIGVEIPPGVWHTVIADSPGAVIFEVKAGPFDPSRAKEWAVWAPSEDSADALTYMAALRQRITALR